MQTTHDTGEDDDDDDETDVVWGGGGGGVDTSIECALYVIGGVAVTRLTFQD